MMNIQQRAEKYSHSGCEPIPLSYQREAEFGYIRGATDQRKIDIDKACAWLKVHLPRVLDRYYPDTKDECDTDVLNEDMREDFRQAMMED